MNKIKEVWVCTGAEIEPHRKKREEQRDKWGNRKEKNRGSITYTMYTILEECVELENIEKYVMLLFSWLYNDTIWRYIYNSTLVNLVHKSPIIKL